MPAQFGASMVDEGRNADLHAAKRTPARRDKGPPPARHRCELAASLLRDCSKAAAEPNLPALALSI
jgi:hypothetical protein